ncbi:unnamed protein product [Scytosiphon promiscuus]
MSVADVPAVGVPAATPVNGWENSEEGAQPVEPYFWEEGGNPSVDWWAKVRHSLHFGGVKAIAGAEAIGEASTETRMARRLGIFRSCTTPVVANTLGLNDSKYQYVIDALEADEMRAQREKRDEEDRQKVAREEEASRARELENQQDGETKQDAGAIELGDTTLSLPGSSSSDTPPPQA